MAPALDCFKEEDAPKKQPPSLAEPEASTKEPEGAVAPAAPEDSLDAFMAVISAEVAKPSEPKPEAPTEAFLEDDDDPAASYWEAYQESQKGGKKKDKPAGADAMMADDEDGAANVGDKDEEEENDRRLKPIEPLPAVDHNSIEYAEVRMKFYTPHLDIAKLSAEEVDSLRQDMRIAATGSNCPHPVVSFGHLGLPEELMQGIRKIGYISPTPIQSQAIPAALSGRDVIGIAETGSGKTVAYLMPMLVHCADQPVLQKDDGFIGLVLCPTRELAIQIEKETYKFNKTLGLRSTTLAGGLSKYQQFKEVKKGSEIVIATPGRLIDIIAMKGCNLRRCTFLVLDEADRMLQMGFEGQIRSIAQNIRPARQTLFFSATFPPRIERMSRDLLQNPVRVTIGKLGQAAANVTQRVEVVSSEDEKWAWLSRRIEVMLKQGQVLIFAQSKQRVDELAKRLSDELQRQVAMLHGDLGQDERMRVMDNVRKRKADVLIATDVAARGLDVASIRTVVCYDVARDIHTHTHRVGRTGRAGETGEAYTLLLGDAKQRRMAALLVEHMEVVGSPVGDSLRELAMQYAPFRAAHLVGGRKRPVEAVAGAAVPAQEPDEPEEDCKGLASPAKRPRSRSASRERSASPTP